MGWRPVRFELLWFIHIGWTCCQVSTANLSTWKLLLPPTEIGSFVLRTASLTDMLSREGRGRGQTGHCGTFFLSCEDSDCTGLMEFGHKVEVSFIFSYNPAGREQDSSRKLLSPLSRSLSDGFSWCPWWSQALDGLVSYYQGVVENSALWQRPLSGHVPRRNSTVVTGAELSGKGLVGILGWPLCRIDLDAEGPASSVFEAGGMRERPRCTTPPVSVTVMD